MATRKKQTAADKPFVQFSKRMVTAILAFWGIIRLWSVVSVWLNPDISEGMVKIIRGVDDIATVIVLSYTGNSISEKIANGYYRMKEKQAENEKDDKEDEDESVG
jgi:hypothetical protein